MTTPLGSRPAGSVVATAHARYTGAWNPPPAPFLSGAGGLLVYAGPDGAGRILGGRARTLFRTPGLAGFSADAEHVLTASRVHVPGNGCGCLDVPAWSPNGKQIAVLEGKFVPHRLSTVHVAVMRPDGSHRHSLVATTSFLYTEGFLTSPDQLSWSPDGKQIAYDGAGPGGADIGVVDVDGSGQVLLGQGASPAWSPDGTKIAFERQSVTGSGIFVMNPDGSGVHELASFAPDRAMGPGVAWSPDGTRIAFSMGDPPLGWQIQVMNADGSNIHALANGVLGDMPSWSPDGTQIAYHSGWGGKIAVIGADGGGARDLTHHGGCCEHPSWSPDGRAIVFAGLGHELYEMDAAGGSKARRLTFTRAPRWVYRVALHAATGRLLSTFSVPNAPFVAQSIALAGRFAVVASHRYLPQLGITDVFTLFDPHTRRTTSVKLRDGYLAATLVGADSHWIVFKSGFKSVTRLSALNLRTRRVSQLTELRVAPLDLSVSGRRVAWVENVAGHGRIRAIELPR
jgi:dipeptidyl aminopeptidase/acylaminoacyl peptidase